ncbi:glycosyltransferase family 2 protein [Candidatus Gracilibacteria bacterium]|nr:glycosyltransferase family 2 protein [Candidatus Gracilibacteria bacterium]
MEISVVIPTHNRAAVLEECLKRLLAQKGVEFEVIVVDDGSTDETEEVANGFESVRYVKQQKSQQGVARNLGVSLAKGEIILFIGDDIWLEEGALAWHLRRHRENAAANVAVLGFSTWSPELAINDYMLFLEKSGWQFGYGFLNPGFVEAKEPYKFFYTSNISLKKSLTEKEKFNENFKEYGWEDIELGYRLWKNRDLKLFYEPKAKGWHYHLLTEEDLERKMRAVGRSAREFEKLHPEVRVVPRGWKRVAIEVLGWAPFLWVAKRLSRDCYFKVRSWKELMAGYK